MSEAPVSVVIPAYNAVAFIADAIGSVLAQTVAPTQIVVVDDGSTDGTADVVARFGPRVCLVRGEHLGAGAARNVGLATTTQPLVALLDADDTWMPTKLERQVEMLGHGADVVFCLGRNVVDGVSEPGAAVVAPLPSALLSRRSLFDAVGPFNETLATAEWPDWYLRMTDAGYLVEVVDEVLVLRRLHGENMGVVRRGEVGAYARVLKASLDRRRAAAGSR